jgi:hypothetical protein
MTAKPKKDLTPADAARLWVAELERRQNVNELLVKPPRPLSVLNGPATTQAEGDLLVRTVRDWLVKTVEAGAGPQDCLRLFDKFVPFSPVHRHSLRGDFDAALQACTVRELKARALVSHADSVEGARQTALQSAERERASLKAERAKIEARLAQLEASP